MIEVLALLCGAALAGPPITRPVYEAPGEVAEMSIQQLALELRTEAGPDKRMASRELLRLVRYTTSRADKARPGGMSHTEALLTLGELNAEVVPACIRGLSDPSLVRPCAVMLGLLEDPAALPGLQLLSAGELKRRDARAVDKAVGRIKAATEAQ
ncbi:MAG: hypothetical protein KDA24_08070 [Deltaproteobacteria bacterium]|nr:hypothetical protein [Deltaproteobacteria bacterium]